MRARDWQAGAGSARPRHERAAPSRRLGSRARRLVDATGENVMVRMGLVWDRTTEVLQGRSGILARLALLYLFLPGVVSAGVSSIVTPNSALAILSGLISIAATVLLIMGVLAITAVASDPAVDGAHAQRIAAARLLPALAAVALIIVALLLVALPIIALIVQSGATLDPVTQRFDLSTATPGSLGTAGLITLAAAVLGIWVSVKLVPLFAVIVNERLGLGAARRSFRLTRGSVLRLLGVIILYVIVVLVAMAAATSVVGLIARLLLGADAASGVAFVVGVVSSAVTAVATVVQTVFYARFYVAASERAAAATDTHPLT